MTNTNIPQSIQDILDIFIRFNFTRFPYKTIAERLKIKVDTLIQRIRRNQEYFEIDDSQRPSQISIKKGVKEVYFYRDKNQCQICQKVVNPERLSLKFRNPFQDDNYDWKNVLSVCDDCKDKDIVKKIKRIKKSGTIEYKEIRIIHVWKKIPNSDDYEEYYEFDELDGTGSFPLLDEHDKICSLTIADVLNYFAADDWEVIHIETISEEYSDYEDYQIFFQRKREEE